MKLVAPWTRLLILKILVIVLSYSADCYDPLDPTGNVTVTFDIHQWQPDGYVAKVTINNFYKYRHVEEPGWKLGWIWGHNEVIWSMTGAIATQQGNCSMFKNQIPYSCRVDPLIVDLTPDADPDNRSENCCRGGKLAAWAIDPSKSFTSFEMTVGNLDANSSGYKPLNLTLMAPGPGYTCGLFEDHPPTVTPDIYGIREEQVFKTWKSTCTYSSFVANKDPTCCVSLSTFYNPTITECPLCSCGCRPTTDKSMINCIDDAYAMPLYPTLDPSQLVQCTDHMCPIRVHWHIQANYKEHWRVKLTVSNYHYGANYSDWNLMAQHPGFNEQIWTFSFNNSKLDSLASTGAKLADEAALFWGMQNYNTELLEAVEKMPGSVTTEVLLQKDLDSFTLSSGWAFPRRIYFNGENCQMPLPQDFPALPSGSSRPNNGYYAVFLLLCLTITILF